MAINTLTISQTNIINGSNLLSVHNPLAFICDAFYSGQSPDYIFVDLYANGDLVGTYKAIPFKDLTGTLRQFLFMADEIIRGYLVDRVNYVELDDFAQSASTLEYVENLTREMSIVFRDPDGLAADATVSFVACSAASQWGDANGANMTEQFSNIIDTYIAAKGDVCYVYFYNALETNILSINAALNTGYAIDYNGDIFTDSNDDRFIIL